MAADPRTHSCRRSPAASSRYPPPIRNRAFLTSCRTCARRSLFGAQSITALASAPWMSPAICRTDFRAASPSTAATAATARAMRSRATTSHGCVRMTLGHARVAGAGARRHGDGAGARAENPQRKSERLLRGGNEADTQPAVFGGHGGRNVPSPVIGRRQIVRAYPCPSPGDN